MNELSEKETASRVHEYSKGKSNKNILNNLRLMVLIRRITKTEILWLWVYDRYGYGCTTGVDTGIPLERKRAYVRVSNGNFIVTRIILVATSDHLPSHPTNKDEIVTGFIKAHQCGVLMVLAGLPQINFISPGQVGITSTDYCHTSLSLTVMH